MQYKKTSLVIIGAGPRGLACAIQALDIVDSIYIVDDQPTNSWSITSTVADFEMRSPMSFDLVTYSTNHREYSLSNILTNEDIMFDNQKDLEEDTRRLKRAEFYTYLKTVKQMLSLEPNINFIYSKVKNIYNSKIELSTNELLSFDYLILAQGVKEKPIPSSLKSYKQLTNLDILNNFNDSVLVVGSGQGAYDIASYLYNKDINVGLYISKAARIHQYPAPAYDIWGYRSALSNYCSCLPSVQSRIRYIENVKRWGPSITPNNEYLLNTIPIYQNKDMNEIIYKYKNRFICRIGVTPINPLGINFTDVTKNFRIKNTNIFVTGPLAILYDGPRVNSLISSSSTAKQIIEEIHASI